MRTPACLALWLVSGAAAANSLIAPKTATPVAQAAFSVTADREWNRMSFRPGPNDEVWTIDGEPLNALTFYGGIADSQTLFRDWQKRVKPLPKFAGTMLLTDVPPLLEDSYRVARDAVLFRIDHIEPVKFAGAKGIRFTYDFTRAGEDLRRRGEACAAIVGGKLYMTTFEAPALHFFDHDIAAARAVMNGTSIAKEIGAR